ncbi:Oxysterol-binding protein-related protein 2B [Camellia lanceoleosa]|uniref:Oxysterol-binding protein-related protein 2B n=1 Tax=Camellia lanceoleosa TaxID=1840588 RepID=A0ACC0GYE7_9ERIC|nr:Oxysterol-binding protein-related protein 2B [Camellia lanceoleosa]
MIVMSYCLCYLLKQVSHHPTVVACHCKGKFEMQGDDNLRTKFWGHQFNLTLLELQEFDDGEVFDWSKVGVPCDMVVFVRVTTPICNLILGKMYLNHHGTMHISGIRQYSCELKFKEPSILDRNPQ